MGYQLGKTGRVIRTTIVFLCWSYITWKSFCWTLTVGTSHGELLRTWLRTLGLSPVFSDLFKLAFAVVAFVIVPAITTVLVVFINKKLRGICHG